MFKFAGTTLVLYAGAGTARIEQVPDACLYGWCKLFPRELNQQTYCNVFMFQIIRVLAQTLLILSYSYVF